MELAVMQQSAMLITVTFELVHVSARGFRPLDRYRKRYSKYDVVRGQPA
jgi:hypothetical protein